MPAFRRFPRRPTEPSVARERAARERRNPIRWTGERLFQWRLSAPFLSVRKAPPFRSFSGSRLYRESCRLLRKVRRSIKGGNRTFAAGANAHVNTSEADVQPTSTR